MGESMPGKQRRPAAAMRQHILTIAAQLFYTAGIRAVGMDTIVRAAGIGTMTLYRQFPTKDDLVVAYVQLQSQAWWERFTAVFTRDNPDPWAYLAAFFAQIDRDIAAHGFRGCPFLNTITEFPDPTHPAHVAALTHKQEVRAYLHEIAATADATNPAALADALIILMDGAYETAQAFGPTGPARQTWQLAQTLLAQQRHAI